jgi:hypothetical protein
MTQTIENSPMILVDPDKISGVDRTSEDLTEVEYLSKIVQKIDAGLPVEEADLNLLLHYWDNAAVERGDK